MLRHLFPLLSLLLLASCTSDDRPSPTAAAPSAPTVPADSTRAVAPPSLPASPPATADAPDAAVQAQIEQYLDRLTAAGFDPQQQGVWLQTDDAVLADVRGTQAFPAASVTKIATTLAALRRFEIDRRFATEFQLRGELQDGVLDGDLVVVGGSDPMFVWEEAIAVGNRLNQLGLRRVTGDLLVTGLFYMNFEEDVARSGELLKQGLNAATWSGDAEAQYRTLPADTPRPQVDIAGTVRVVDAVPDAATPLLRHHSLPVPELLKLMNRYSNNAIAHTLANALGGADAVVREVLDATGVPADEIQLSNGSGLGRDNQISPRTAAEMYRAINRELAPHNLTVGDVVAIAGEPEGILTARPLPPQAVVKSGSINAVSTISGALPTQERGIVWFGILNGGGDTNALRAEQERLLAELEAQWGAVETLPPELAMDPQRRSLTSEQEVLR